MADGRETRAQIDSETVRGLLLINGGGAVALLAFLTAILVMPGFETLARAVICAVFFFQVGLACAVIHNRFRRLCSMEYAKKEENRKQCTFLGRTEPCICWWSTAFMWSSITMFVAAGLVVLVAALMVVGHSRPAFDSPHQMLFGQTYALPPNYAFERTAGGMLPPNRLLSASSRSTRR